MKSRDEIYQKALAVRTRAGRPVWLILFGAMTVAGTMAFILGISGPEGLRAWQAYLVNFVFWTGLAAGAVLISAAIVMTNANWGRPVKRIAEALGTFLPVAFVLFWVLFFGREDLFYWVRGLPPELQFRETWLSSSFFFFRNGLGLFALAAVAALLIYHSVRPDVRTLSGDAPEAADLEGHAHMQIVLSPIYALLYSIILSLIAFDFIMSLDPHWVSTLFGAYYFIGSFYLALAAVTVLACIAVRSLDLGSIIRPKQFHDLGKLMLGFCIVTGDFFYAQFLVIWYGNLPEETKFIVHRLHHAPWEAIAWLVLMVVFVGPFLVFLIRKIKMQVLPMLIISSIILVGMWIERFLLIAPSIWKEGNLPLGITEVLITTGFLGVVGLCLMSFLKKFPVLPLSDPLLYESLRDEHH